MARCIQQNVLGAGSSSRQNGRVILRAVTVAPQRDRRIEDQGISVRSLGRVGGRWSMLRAGA